MSKFQLWSRDEYGQGSIHATNEDVSVLIKQAEKLVNDANVDNALTVDDKKRNWESFIVKFVGEEGVDIVYGGKNNSGGHIVYSITDGKVISSQVSDLDQKPEVYLGHLDTIKWVATDSRGNEIDNLDHADLIGKTYYFVKSIS
ncbi:hypothetical protein LCGC14_1684010 [marine sediment metagenome]|uniref:Uncharacterized protein n=1 Tax=marine sediment metagenome TaxID=412755 RepID=A0A0F9IA86_9ZZZZ